MRRVRIDNDLNVPNGMAGLDGRTSEANIYAV